MTNNIEQHLTALKVVLPPPPAPVADYVPYMIDGKRVYISGQLPMRDGQMVYCGRVGEEISLEDAQAAGRLCAVNILAQLKAACDGDLNRVEYCVKLGNFIQTGPGFSDHSKVSNEVSRLMRELFTPHARFTVGCSSLPLNAAVEVDALFVIQS